MAESVSLQMMSLVHVCLGEGKCTTSGIRVGSVGWFSELDQPTPKTHYGVRAPQLCFRQCAVASYFFEVCSKGTVL